MSAPHGRRLGALLAALAIAGTAVVIAQTAQAVPTPAGPAGYIRTMGGVTRNFVQGGYGPEDVPATESQFSGPRGLAFAPNGDVYVTDSLNHLVRKIDSNGVVSLVAGTPPVDFMPQSGEGGDEGPASAALLREPHGVAVDSRGNVYIADSRNCVIRKVDTRGVISRFAGTGQRKPLPSDPYNCAHSDSDPQMIAGGQLLNVALDQPKQMFMTQEDGKDLLWFTDRGNNMLRRIDIVNGEAEKMTRIAGARVANSYNDGDSTLSTLRHPEGIWVANDGTVYFTDGGNNLVRKIVKTGPSTYKVATIAGDKAAAEAHKLQGGDLPGDSDGDGGLAVNAHLDEPRGITGDNQGHLYVAEEHGARIRRINLTSGIIDTVAGDGTVAEQRTNAGSAWIKGENGPSLETQFNHLHDIQLNPADGSLWIADSRNNRVRAISDPADAPGAILATGGGTATPAPTTTTTVPKTTTTTAPTTTTSTTTTTTGQPGPDSGGTAGNPDPGSDTTGAPAARRSGYWMVGSDGVVYPFGDARSYGNAATSTAVDLEPTPSGNGYWIVDDQGRVFAFGDAVARGSVEHSRLAAKEKVTSLSATNDGGGYWIFTDRGRVLTFGNAPSLGDVSDVRLAGPVLDSIVTPSGKGYYMVASDGGIFSFGDAHFYGSMGGQKLNAPVQSLVPDADGVGYWLVASDGGIFAFQADFKGSLGAFKLNKPVTGMVRAGTGYLMVGEDGGIFDFSGDPTSFKGSLGKTPPAKPITSVAVLAAG